MPIAGVASVSALTAIRTLCRAKKYSLAHGIWDYMGKDAIALGVKGDVSQSLRLTTGLGYSNSRTTFNAGMGFSF